MTKVNKCRNRNQNSRYHRNFSTRGDFKVKRLQPIANGDLLIILDNDKYQNETITAEMLAKDIHMQALVIKKIGDP